MPEGPAKLLATDFRDWNTKGQIVVIALSNLVGISMCSVSWALACPQFPAESTPKLINAENQDCQQSDSEHRAPPESTSERTDGERGAT